MNVRPVSNKTHLRKHYKEQHKNAKTGQHLNGEQTCIYTTFGVVDLNHDTLVEV